MSNSRATSSSTSTSALQGQFDRMLNSMNQMMAREIGIMRKEAKDQFRSLEARLTVLESRATGATVGDDPRQADRLRDLSQATVLNARTFFNDDRHVPPSQPTFPIPQEGVDVGACRNLGFCAQRHTRLGAPDPGGVDSPDDRGQREGTYESGRTNISQSDFRIKREDMGIFNPVFKDPDDLGVVQDGKSLIYTVARRFIDRLMTFMEDDVDGAVSRQLIQQFPALLGGTAVLWWSDELLPNRRSRLRDQGLPAMLEALEERFAPDALTATSRFNNCFLTLKEVAQSDQALTQYIQRKMRWARSMGIFARDNANWQGVMVQIWTHMDLTIRQYLRSPSSYFSLERYMQEVEKSRSIVLAAALDKYPYAQKKSSGHGSGRSHKADDKSIARYTDKNKHPSSNPFYRNDRFRDSDRSHNRGSHRDYNRDRERNRAYNHRDDRDRRQEDSHYRDDRDRRQEDGHHREDRNKRKDDHHRDSRQRDDKHDNRENRPRDRVHLANETSPGSEADESGAESVSPYTSSSTDKSEVACMVIDSSLTFRKCHKAFKARSEI